MHVYLSYLSRSVYIWKECLLGRFSSCFPATRVTPVRSTEIPAKAEQFYLVPANVLSRLMSYPGKCSVPANVPSRFINYSDEGLSLANTILHVYLYKSRTRRPLRFWNFSKTNCAHWPSSESELSKIKNQIQMNKKYILYSTLHFFSSVLEKHRRIIIRWSSVDKS